jgi:Cft2 family RNA processing exonuclease
MHPIEAGGARFLLDCSLFQGPRAQGDEINRHFPFPPSSIDAVVLSHAHLDHCSNLPTLAAAGFRGPIYCTTATKDLTALVLHDSAKVQHQNARSINIEESKALNSRTDPFIVIATSGMCESGRILYHLSQHIGDPRAALLIVSFQGASTLGRRLAEGVSPVHILGESHDVRLEVKVLPAFSGHAGRSELLACLQKISRVGHVYCVHGEEAQSVALVQRLAAAGYAAVVPIRGQTVEV